MEKTVYTDNGYLDRQDYLKNLADDYDVDLDTVFSIADMLGKEEDFDGLILALEDLNEENF